MAGESYKCSEIATLAVLKANDEMLIREVVELKKVYDTLQTIALNIVEMTTEIKHLKLSVNGVQTEVRTIKDQHQPIAELALEVKHLQKSVADVKQEIKDEIQSVSIDIDKATKDINEIKQQPANDFHHYKKTIVGWLIVAILGAAVGKYLI